MKIGWLPGDGIGLEVLEAAKMILEWLDEKEKAGWEEQAVSAVIQEG